MSDYLLKPRYVYEGLKAVYNFIEWDGTSACVGASGCCYQFIFDLTHPPNPCMKLEIDHHTGNYVPYSFR